ncbi:hypothetical protein [Liquorilactobacillus mali]|uniref:hypothetical protein n=2 Tax=Liquorilactobacillus mali TaxID=1618 RepID=UPI0039E80A5E
MSMEDIVFTFEFDDANSNIIANDYLENGWRLLHVGQKTVIDPQSKQMYYTTVYVVGATSQVYESWKEEQFLLREKAARIKEFVKANDNGNF